MKKTIIILSAFLFSFFYTTTNATNCSPRILQEEKINFALCDNYGRCGERTYILFKARVKVLNDYIKDKIAKGELEDKKFEIDIYDPVYLPYMELTQGKNGYFVNMSGQSYPTLEELITIVDYFAKPDWKPFIVDFSPKRNDETDEAAGRRYRFNVQKTSNLYKSGEGREPYSYQPFTIWEKDGVSLEYSGDSLKYAINGVAVPFKVNATLPVKIQDRYLFFEEEYIYVVQDMETIKTFEIDKTYLESHTGKDNVVYVHSKWVNICWHSDMDSWFYSYSYDKNRFYSKK